MKKLFLGLGAVAAVVTPVVAVVSCGSSSTTSTATLHYQDANKVATFSIENDAFNKVLTAGGLVADDFNADGSVKTHDAKKLATINAVAGDTDSIQTKLQAVLTGATVSIGLWPHGELEFIVTGILKAELKAKLTAGLDNATVKTDDANGQAMWEEIKALVKAAL